MGFQKFVVYSILIGAIIYGGINGQESNEESHGSAENFDATVGGANGNPGAKIRFSAKALDAIYDHAISKVTEMIKALKLPDVMIPVDGGMLSIKSSQIVEAKIPNYNRELSPPNEIHSRFHGGSIKSEGQWQYKPHGVASRSSNSGSSGVFRTYVVNAELNVTSKLDRTNDGRPMAQNQYCKASLGQFRVEIEGFGNASKPTVIDQCDNYLCKRILAYFEDSVCNAARRYVSEYINKKLATFPHRINLGNQFILDYRVMSCDPVAENFIQGDLEGEVVSRSGSGANFHAFELSPMEMMKAISFSLGDYAFNTLFHQAHQQQFPFSAHELLANDSTHWEALSLNCSASSSSSVVGSRELKPTPSTTKSTKKTTTRSTTTKRSTTSKSTTSRPMTTSKSTTTRKPTTTRSTPTSTSTTSKPSTSTTTTSTTRRTSPRRWNRKDVAVLSVQGNKHGECLGVVVDNSTSDGQFRLDGAANLLFKSQRPLQVFVNSDKSKNNYFAAKGGYVEIYEACDHSDNPKPSKVLFRADVKSMKGQFFPKLDGSNITGSIEIDELELSKQQQPSPMRHLQVSDEMLDKLAKIIKPILASMFNSFLQKFAQFPVPLIEGYECEQPSPLRFWNHTMNVECNIRVLPNAIRKN